MTGISNEKAIYSAELIFDAIKQCGFRDDAVRLYSEITRDFTKLLLDKPKREFREIDHKRICFEGISLLTALYFFDELPKVIKKRKFLFLHGPDSELLYQFRKQVLHALKSKLDTQGYNLVRDVNVTGFDSETNEISFGVSSPLDISTRIALYSKQETIKEVSKKFTMKLAYALDPHNIVALQMLGPVFVGPFQKMAEIILNKVFATYL